MPAITQMSISMSISGGRNAWRSVSMHVDISFRKSSIIQLWDIEDIISFGVLQNKKYSLENRLYSPFAFSHQRNQKKKEKKNDIHNHSCFHAQYMENSLTTVPYAKSYPRNKV